MPLRKWRLREKPPFEVKWETDGGNSEELKKYFLIHRQLYTGFLVIAWHKSIQFLKSSTHTGEKI
jgi:hypothetical protein